MLEISDRGEVSIDFSKLEKYRERKFSSTLDDKRRKEEKETKYGREKRKTKI